jgi:hypothetical protein
MLDPLSGPTQYTKAGKMDGSEMAAYFQEMGLESGSDGVHNESEKDEEIKRLREKLEKAEKKLGGWKLMARQVINCILLTPAMNGLYSNLLKDMLSDVLVAQVPQVGNSIYWS